MTLTGLQLIGLQNFISFLKLSQRQLIPFSKKKLPNNHSDHEKSVTSKTDVIAEINCDGSVTDARTQSLLKEQQINFLMI